MAFVDTVLDDADRNLVPVEPVLGTPASAVLAVEHLKALAKAEQGFLKRVLILVILCGEVRGDDDAQAACLSCWYQGDANEELDALAVLVDAQCVAVLAEIARILCGGGGIGRRCEKRDAQHALL